MPALRKCSVPSKTFLIGEYLALVGGPSLVLTFEPRFTLAWTPGTRFQGFHPKSPAGLLLASRLANRDLQMTWSDPFSGAGGFGASTAQFLAAVCLTSETPPSPAAVFELYRSLHQDAPLPPSGADLVAQQIGGLALVERDPFRAEALQISLPSLLIFSATSIPERKTATHSHLDRLREQGFPSSFSSLLEALRASSHRAVQAVRSEDLSGLGQEMNLYGSLLHQHGLESAATTALRTEISQMPEVLGVKGSGALQTDALVVLTRPGVPAKPLLEKIESRGLRCIVRGFNPGPGAVIS